ncbi:MAG: sodium:glutamate symporter [Planctomycetes bacterium]|nr:sodium:glutamate symporter [Planctomycetota bacterium]
MQWAILSTCGLLLVGFVLRARLRFLQVLYIPASVLGGLIGLAALLAIRFAVPDDAPADAFAGALRGHAEAIGGTLRSWPGVLIAVVFAGLLLERPERRLATASRGTAMAAAYVWVVVLGEVVVGLLAAWLVIMPATDLPASFGQLIEAGFAGGHGTAAALGLVYADLGFPDGHDLGLFSATVGLLASVVIGIALVNIGVRRGWTATGRADRRLVSGLEQRADPKPMAYARVGSEVIDAFMFQLVLVAMAFGVGALLRWLVSSTARWVSLEDAAEPIGRLPLFLFTLIGGLLVRKALALFRCDDLIDGESIKRIVAIAMEVLIVAAVASLRLETLASYFWPMALLMALGCAWAVFCLLVLARRLLPPEYWFELGIINFGMSTGTTAQGMMLLRIVDRDLETGAAEDYALAAPFSAPFIGGGAITLTLPLLLDKGLLPVVLPGLVLAIAVALVVGATIARKSRRRSSG